MALDEPARAPREERRHCDDDGDDDRRHPRKTRRENFPSDLFDF